MLGKVFDDHNHLSSNDAVKLKGWHDATAALPATTRRSMKVNLILTNGWWRRLSVGTDLCEVSVLLEKTELLVGILTRLPLLAVKCQSDEHVTEPSQADCDDDQIHDVEYGLSVCL